MKNLIEMPLVVITEKDPEYPAEYLGTGATFYLRPDGLLMLA